MLKHFCWDEIEVEKLNPLLGRQFVVGKNVMVARILLSKGCIVPEHRHVNEQISYVLEGALKFWVEGREMVARGGELVCIPPDMPHKVEALEDTIALDIFNPPREDWMNGNDQYLR